jgi:hypothetical protein
MKLAPFFTEQEASDGRRRHGGGRFISDEGHAFWFGLTFTPSTILVHPVLCGMSGVLK